MPKGIDRNRAEAGSLVSKIDSFLLAVRRWEYKVADGAWFIKSDARGRERKMGGEIRIRISRFDDRLKRDRVERR